MLTKFETKSNRVKGLSFHPARPWILASLHNGIIQLWDYRIRTLLDKFDEHEGPVRGICFHSTQPLFVSGGDDYKIKVWNYKSRRCLFTLLGHLDYIRTVEFHKESPWILSSSDDQTIRIWNWQSRTCISVLTGHNHYVMCASFHPKEDLVVSASLDQTVRVWDISGLRKKTTSIRPSQENDPLRLQNDLFGNTDAIVKYVLEGHDRGVNWAAFHPSFPLIVSGADDRQVKLWRMGDSKTWEVDTFRGHFNNVSCALFHPRQELIISDSEDKTIRIWDMAKRTGIQTFRREHDRFWILTCHPELNLFAAGHDNGMIVFKLERERPAYASLNNEGVYFLKDKYVRHTDLSSSRDGPILPLRRGGVRVQSMSFNPPDRALLVNSDTDGGTYELYIVPKDSSKAQDSVDCKQGKGVVAVFTGRDRFAVLEKYGGVIVRNLKNEEVRKCNPPFQPEWMFAGPTGMVLLRGEEKIALYDLQQRVVMAELTTPFIKYAVWSNSSTNPMLALFGRDTLILCSRRLEQLCMIHETIRIKSGAWDENGVFLYTTLNHIKYCLPNGDNGIIRTLDQPVYITAVRGSKVYCLDRECKNRAISLDPTEYLFKLALVQKRYSDVLRMVREKPLIGTSIVAYLERKGFPEVALHFVKDERTRFSLALECGNIEIALEAAQVLDDKDCWHRLGVEALRQGNHQVVEMAYQRTKNFERLSFLYLITGNTDKLKKMLRIAEMRQDPMGRFHNALYLGDVEERVKLLNEVGMNSLAYMAAATHGLEKETEILGQRLAGTKVEGEEGEDAVDAGALPQPRSDAQLLQPPTPIMKLHESNWPLLTVSRGVMFEDASGGIAGRVTADDLEEGEAGAGWGDDDAGEEGEAKPKKADGGWGDDDDVDINVGDDEPSSGAGGWDEDELEGLDSVDIAPVKSGKDSFWTPPTPGVSVKQMWTRSSNLAADHIAAGSFESAMGLLNQQVGAVNFAPLKPFFMSYLMASSVSLPTIPGVPSIITPLNRNSADLANPKMRATALPMLPMTLNPLVERLKAAYRCTTEGKFGDAMTNFLYIMHALLFIVAENRQEVGEAKELLGLCREYVTGLRMELYRKELATGAAPVASPTAPAPPKAGTEAVRQAELAAYFTHCNLQPPHLILSLRSAMNSAHKVKNYQNAASFAKRLLELNPSADYVTQARKVLKFAEQNPTNENKLLYDERNPFVVCNISFVPIYRGSPMVRCSYCASPYLPEHEHKVCPTCQIAEIGKEAPGLLLTNEKEKERR
eukprot:TRINITY_DN894_c0_g1_i4.p1 TRINITY_DN894_c0_g1~~TRINITY_DN894_c0_g1_i4.p1  ORF type:complete len:1261 (+),score=453.13 TRINITY_DN894_c0_g1_i4:106-3888(+)